MSIKQIQIKNKSVYIFEDHNEAIIPWQQISSLLNSKPALLTLDYHTDTHLGLLNYIHNILNIQRDYQQKIKKSNEISSQPFNILKIVEKLRNDEQIDFAIRANFISHAYVISQNNSMFTIKSTEEQQWWKEKRIPQNIINFNIPKPIGKNYILPENKIIELDNDIFDILEIYEERLQKDLVIDDKVLSHKISKIMNINCSIFGSNYDFLNNFILDIDLDYFNTLNAINPEEKNIFYSLIYKAKAITIAKESYFVNDLKLDKTLSVDFLLERLLNHIEQALS
jgi:hypothetical protein